MGFLVVVWNLLRYEAENCLRWHHRGTTKEVPRKLPELTMFRNIFLYLSIKIYYKKSTKQNANTKHHMQGLARPKVYPCQRAQLAQPFGSHRASHWISQFTPKFIFVHLPITLKTIHDRFRTIKTCFLIEDGLNADMDRDHNRGYEVILLSVSADSILYFLPNIKGFIPDILLLPIVTHRQT